MLRIQPTGNATFDAVEVTAFAAYELARQGPKTDVTIKNAEIAYLLSCWQSAITQLSSRDYGSNFNGYIVVGHNIAVPLDNLAKNLASMLIDRGFVLPTSVTVAKSAVVASAGISATVGDTLTVLGGGGSPYVAPQFSVLTVSGGGVLTVAPKNMGLVKPPVANDATTSSSNINSSLTTLTVTYAELPVDHR